MPVEPGVVDANILVYAVNSGSPRHAASRALLEAALDPTVSLYVTSQILCEFYSLITNPKHTAMAWTSGEAVQLISELLVSPGLNVLRPRRKPLQDF
jgi:predicted nucleic acid-binding protein